MDLHITYHTIMDNNSDKIVSPIRTAGAYFFCMLTAFIIMLICTRSSPLYVFNNWDDSNSYFTVGKSIFKGLVPYRDLFDQKGMMLYTLYGIASLLSYKSFLGVFVIETIAAALTCIAVLRIYDLYMRTGISLFLMPFTAAFIYSTRSFWWGGSAEEMMMPLFMWGMYLSIRYFKTEYPKPVSDRTLIIGGILAGCVLNIKFNSLGFFFAWMVMILIADLTIDPKSCIRHGCIFLLGMFIATIPWIIYFAINGAIYDWIHVYIYLNVFVYSEKLPLAQRFYNMLKIVYSHMLSNPYCGVLAGFGGASFIVMKSRWIEKLNIIMLSCCTALVIFIGGVELQYYSLPLWSFVVLGGVALGRIAEYLIRSQLHEKRMYVRLFAGLCSLFLAGIISYMTSMNTFFMKYDKDDMWLYHFTDIIENSGIENPTLINMGCFDAGLYTTCGIVPTCRFFQTQTIKISDVGDVQGDFIRNGRTDFVLIRDNMPEHIDDHYELITSEEWEQSGYDLTYYLYRKVR
ncbi:hypothetical protein [Butyrivibrio fibrisolvens]|nr:hypothetical protein [Butyrivibrio fibrisolvens]